MTNLVRRVLGFVALLLLFLLGVEFLLWAVLLQTGEPVWFLRSFVIGFDSLSPAGQFSFAACLVLLPLFLMTLNLRADRKQVILQAKSKDGEPISIAEEALKRCLHHEIGAIPEVAGMKSRARNGQAGPRVVIRLWIWAGSNVPAVRRVVRENAARTLRNLFGLGEIENIAVIVEGLVFRKEGGKKVGRRLSRAKAEQEEQ
jgi:hypothetical protein